MILALVSLGLLAGVLTTIAGQGGGLVLLLACSALVGPHAALALTSVALLLGNTHRALLFRRAIDRPVACRMIFGAVPGALAGGLVAGAAPPIVLHALMLALTALALAKAAGLLAFAVPRGALAPSGLVVGGLTGAAGGAGVLFAPILLSAGLTGAAFVGTSSAIAVAAHLGRVVAYGAGGLYTSDLVLPTLLVAAAIFAGNALGERLRASLRPGTAVRIEHGTLVVCVALSIAGAA
jgi:uncharacterized protein